MPWFLLFFIYTHGLSVDDLGIDFYMWGIIPVLSVPWLNIVIAPLCLLIAVVVLLEPLLPPSAKRWSIATRNYPISRYVYQVNVLTAFVLGLFAGLAALIENLPTFSLLITSVAYVGFAIFIAMGIKLVLNGWTRHGSTKAS